MRKFLLEMRAGRWLTTRVHRLVHPGISHGLRFAFGGCWLCRWVWSDLELPPFEDHSRIEVAPHEPGKKAVVMTATAKRQIEEIIRKHPEAKAELEAAIEEIRRKP